MAAEINQSIRTHAIEWHLRLRDGDDAAWDAFTQWLEQDPSHVQAYELIEQTDQAIEPLLADVVFRPASAAATQPATALQRRRRWWPAAGALAASVAVAVSLYVVRPFAPQRYELATGPGEHRTVALDGSTQVMLNGSTRMSFDRRNPRFAALIAGEALFHVQHDPKRPFTLEVGDRRVEDIGTVFNVVRDPDEVRVAVSEGKVAYVAAGKSVPLDVGQALVDRPASGTIRVMRTAAASVGSWERGRLLYQGEPLSQVAADLGRSLGIRIVASPSIADRPFSGAIALDGTSPAQLDRLKSALNVALVSGPDGWTMTPIDNGGR